MSSITLTSSVTPGSTLSCILPGTETAATDKATDPETGNKFKCEEEKVVPQIAVRGSVKRAEKQEKFIREAAIPKSGKRLGIKEVKGRYEAAVSETGKNQESKGKSHEHNRDISSKAVSRVPVLCAQFLWDNSDIPVLKDVHPEAIEDISERYIPNLGTEFDSDSVKKIRILDIGNCEGTKGKAGNRLHFLVSLIDHKSLVDYDASMQLLRYMMYIWTEYRWEMETAQKGCISRKISGTW